MDKIDNGGRDIGTAGAESWFTNKLIAGLLLLIIAMLVINIWFPRLTHAGDNQDLYQISLKINTMSEDIKDSIKLQKKLNDDFAKLLRDPSLLNRNRDAEDEDINSVLRRYSPGNTFIYKQSVVPNTYPIQTTKLFEQAVQ